MKAALLTDINKPLEMVELEPCELSYGQVLVRILASGICGAQLQEIRGEKGSHFPRLMGHEGCGIVEEIGLGVKTVNVGDKVVMHWRNGDGIECEPPRYGINAKGDTITGGQVVTFATHSICSEHRLTAVPNTTPVELCALLGCGLSTALGTIEHEANLKMGESVLIIGCGGLGFNLILAAKMRQASSISVVDISLEKKVAAENSGAEFFHSNEWHEAPISDVVIDTTGNVQAITTAIQFVAPSGRFIMVGQPRLGFAVTLSNARHLFDGEGKSIKATQGGCFQPAKDIPRYVRLHQAGLMNLDGIISHRISLDRINDGIALVRNGQAGRVLIEP